MDRCPKHGTDLVDGKCLVCMWPLKRGVYYECATHSTPLTAGGRCTACEADAAQRRAASAARDCPHTSRSMGPGGLVCRACNAQLVCEHPTVLRLADASPAMPGVLHALRQCEECGLIGVESANGNTMIWMQRKG